MTPGKRAGSAAKSRLSAGIPPAEAPIVTMSRVIRSLLVGCVKRLPKVGERLSRHSELNRQSRERYRDRAPRNREGTSRRRLRDVQRKAFSEAVNLEGFFHLGDGADSHELRQRPDVELHHHAGAVRLEGLCTHAELEGDSLVRLPGEDALENAALPRTEGLKDSLRPKRCRRQLRGSSCRRRRLGEAAPDLIAGSPDLPSTGLELTTSLLELLTTRSHIEHALSEQYAQLDNSRKGISCFLRRRRRLRTIGDLFAATVRVLRIDHGPFLPCHVNK